MKRSLIGLALASTLITNIGFASVPDTHNFIKENTFNSSNVMSLLHKGHPRLLVQDNSFANIKKNMVTDQEMNALVSEIIRRADDSLNKDTIAFRLTGNDASPSLLDTSRKAIDIILNNALRGILLMMKNIHKKQ